ncbi:nitroreductase family protein [Flavisphingomonas formosensis]|uniref:nitroreductase family protein n=1 Tax=Flavisphingomonas formosensis TaxID=861534 RepID=UPI0012F961ED|nr:nitroreductase family protein [Sphingomonas formosensis]
MCDFLPSAVPAEILRAVLDSASERPSITGSSPWEVYIVSGAARDRLSSALVEAALARSIAEVPGEGLQGHSRSRQNREDLQRYFGFFGAPHLFLVSMEPGEGRLLAGVDAGIHAGTFLSLLRSYGLSGVSQSHLRLFTDTIRSALAIDGPQEFLSCIAFGYPASHAESPVLSVALH